MLHNFYPFHPGIFIIIIIIPHEGKKKSFFVLFLSFLPFLVSILLLMCKKKHSRGGSVNKCGNLIYCQQKEKKKKEHSNSISVFFFVCCLSWFVPKTRRGKCAPRVLYFSFPDRTILRVVLHQFTLILFLPSCVYVCMQNVSVINCTHHIQHALA